jgi:hypothetical protein
MTSSGFNPRKARLGSSSHAAIAAGFMARESAFSRRRVSSMRCRLASESSRPASQAAIARSE